MRKERKPTNLRLAVGGSRGGHFASSSSSLPAVLLEDSQLKKKPRIEVAGGEGNETSLGSNVIDLDEQKEDIWAEGP